MIENVPSWKDKDTKDLAVIVFDDALKYDLSIWEGVSGPDVYVRAVRLMRLVYALNNLLCAWERQNLAWDQYLANLCKPASKKAESLGSALTAVARDHQSPQDVRLGAALRALEIAERMA